MTFILGQFHKRWQMPQPSVTKIHQKITYLKFHSNFSGANELISHYSQREYRKIWLLTVKLNIDQALWRHMVSMSHDELILWSQITDLLQMFWNVFPWMKVFNFPVGLPWNVTKEKNVSWKFAKKNSCFIHEKGFNLHKKPLTIFPGLIKCHQASGTEL